MRSLRWAATIGLLWSGMILTAPARAADDKITFDQVNTTWTVASDGTSVAESEVDFGAPKENPSRVVEVPMVWSASVETLTIVQARIDKQDGRQIVLGPEAIREDPPTGDRYFHEFSDQHRLMITFPNTDAGDELVVRTRRVAFHPRVPGGFMTAPVLDPSVGWKDVNYTINVPTTLPFHIETRGFEQQSEVIIDRTAHYIKAKKEPVSAPQAGVLSDFDRLPMFAVSTFPDWDAFAKAYAGVLLPHAQVTPAIRALAAKLTEGQTTQKDQARLLFDWVRDHIRYIGVPLEESRPEPNDAERVMTKLYGDCKDHVVLFLALLAARDIPAEIVLLNDSNSGTIAGPPNLRPMNHLILYLPSLDLYADTTLAAAQIGVLPFPELGKPAIHLGGTGPALRPIAMPLASDLFMELKTDTTLKADGTVSGVSTTTANGAFGIWLRRGAMSIGTSEDENAGAAAALLQRRGTPGTGQFYFDPPDSTARTYAVRGKFELRAKSGMPFGGFFALWTGLRILPRPGDVLAGPLGLEDAKGDDPTFCYPGRQREALSLTFPDDRKMGTLPPDGVIDTDLVHYQSHWSLEGHRVSVVRTFESLAPGPVCNGETRRKMADVLEKIRADLNNLVGLRVDKIEASPLTTAIPVDRSND